MPKQYLPIAGFQQGGVVVDADAFSLLPQEWSNARNVRFDNRSVSKISGEEVMRTLTGGTRNQPIFLRYWEQPGNDKYIWVDADGGVYLTDNNSDDEVTKGTGGTRESLNPNNVISGGPFNGGATFILNDNVDAPQYLHANATTQEFQDLPGWSYDTTYSNVRAGIVRPFQGTLVAANLTYTVAATNAIIQAPGTYRVSNQAAPGAVPQSWDPQLDSADTAEEGELSATDSIVDMVELQRSLLIYTTDSVHALTLTGNSTFPVSVQPQITGRGALATDCVKSFYGRHFVVGKDDIYLYGGGPVVESVADERVRDYFFNNLHKTHFANTFITHNQKQDEMWVFFPNLTSTGPCNDVMIFNYKHNTWTFRDTQQTRAADYGPVYNSFSSPTRFNNNERTIVVGDFANNRLVATDRTNSFAGQPITAFIEKKGYDVAPNATQVSKWTDDIYFIIRGTGNVTIKVRATDTPGRPVNFSSKTDSKLKTRNFSLDPDMGDYKIDPVVNGRYFNLRIESSDATDTWSLIRYNIAVEVADEGRG